MFAPFYPATCEAPWHFYKVEDDTGESGELQIDGREQSTALLRTRAWRMAVGPVLALLSWISVSRAVRRQGEHLGGAEPPAIGTWTAVTKRRSGKQGPGCCYQGALHEAHRFYRGWARVLP